MTETGARLGAVAGLAGRRIDDEGAIPARFPLAAVARVHARLTSALSDQVVVLVCSAACGADLIALEVAEASGIERHVILPYESARFRKTSVVDRPGDWGPRFDHALEVATTVTVLTAPADERGFAEANVAILDRAAALARPHDAIAIAVWEGQAREHSDMTAQFLNAARERGLRTVEVPTR